MINISAAMGAQFAWSAAEFTEEMRQLGPNPLKMASSRKDLTQLQLEEKNDLLKENHKTT